MAENEQILFNYLLSINNKPSEDLNDIVKQEEIENKDNDNIDNTKSNGQKSFNINYNPSNLEKNNGKENLLNLPLNNETKISSLKDFSIKDYSNKKNMNNNINSSESKNNIPNINKEKEDDYNICFKNRMDMMQAVLDDELNISSEDNNFIRRRGKSKTTIKQSDYEQKKDKNKKEDNKLKETIEDKYFNKANGNENIKQNNIDEIKNKYDFLFEEKDNKIENSNKSIIMESPKIKEENKNYRINNKITEEIKLEIFNEKHSNKKRINSYIDINFDKSKNKNNKNNSERIKNKEKSEFKHFNIENNNNFLNINKVKINFNKSSINTKDFKNNNLLNRYSSIPISNKYYNNSNNKNNILKINNNNNKKFPETLESLINKINKIKNIKYNSKIKNNNNSIISQKLKDIKDSLQKITDDKMPKNSNNKNNSLNKNYFHVLDDSFKIRKKNFSRNYIFSKNIDDFEFMNQKNVHNENNVTLPSKKISKKYNSYSNIYTLNNSPINYLLKNKKTINNIKINNLQMLHKNFRMRNILEGNNLSKKINISLERNNSKNNKEENKTIKNKNNIFYFINFIY